MFGLRFIVCFAFALGAGPMATSKRSKGYKDEDVHPSKRFRNNVADLFLGGSLAAGASHSLYVDAKAAGAQHVGDLAKAGHPNNRARDLLRRLLKKSKWPALYWAEVDTMDAATGQTIKISLPFLLPHELVFTLAKHASDNTALFHQSNLGKDATQHLDNICRRLSCEPTKCLALSMWGDGVPFNWDRSQSLDCWTMGLPGLSGEEANLRFPLATLPHKFMVKHKTMDDIMAVLAWSFGCLASGIFPGTRHDGAAWRAREDNKRSKVAGKPLGCKAFLVDVKGDWKFYKECFRLPQHNENRGICWLCSATPRTWKDVSADAPWRSERLSHWDVVQRIMEKGDPMSPVFSIPFLTTKCFRLDWLHIADQGVAANFLGSLFFTLQDKFPGADKDAKLANMFREIRSFYVSTNCQSRLDHLTHTMIKKSGGRCTPKLRGRAADIRALIPCGRQLAMSHLDTAVPMEATAQQMACQLEACYDMLQRDRYEATRMADASRRFCLLAQSMEAHDPVNWATKPKLHLFQELCEESEYCPSQCWTYRDEDMGGSLAHIGRRRGGAFTAQGTAAAVLKKWCAKYNVPRI